MYLFIFLLNAPGNPFHISRLFNLVSRELLLCSHGVPRAGAGARTRVLFTIPPAVAPTNKSALAVAGMEIFKTKDLNGQFFYCCDRVEGPKLGASARVNAVPLGVVLSPTSAVPVPGTVKGRGPQAGIFPFRFLLLCLQPVPKK